MKKRLPFVLILILMAAGVCVLLYPHVCNLISRMTTSVKIENYNQTVSNIDDNNRRNMLESAKRYNAKLTGVIEKDAFSFTDMTSGSQNSEYMNVLNINGIMGYVEIPSINVYLPIYHTTSQDVLQKGAGHLEGSALPVGGLGTHTVITAHRGLPQAKLFTDLDQLQIGDYFCFHVLGETLAYQVDQINVVEPTETEPLNAVPGKDYATLMTCTPYGINSHRLLVRGIRVPSMPSSEKKADATDIRNELQMVPLWILISASVILVLLIRLIIFKFGKRRIV